MVCRLAQARRAVAALEFAIIAPVFILMLLGMGGLGLYLVYLHEVQELSSAAARSSVAGLSDAERASLAQQFVTTALAKSALLNPGDLTLQTGTSGTPATDYSVTITYSLKDSPIPLLAGVIALPLKDITRTSTVAFGGY
jgi:Flp pilus assembly protein TadG